MKFIFYAIIAGALYLTNPSENDFNLFVKQAVQDRVEEDNAFAKLLIGGVITDLVKSGTYRKDYLLFSVYTVDTSVINAFKQDIPSKVEFLGVMRNFIPLTEF